MPGKLRPCSGECFVLYTHLSTHHSKTRWGVEILRTGDSPAVSLNAVRRAGVPAARRRKGAPGWEFSGGVSPTFRSSQKKHSGVFGLGALRFS